MKHWVILTFILIPAYMKGQDYIELSKTIASLSDTTQFEKLRERKSIPLVVEDSVAFLYQGIASSVVWMGDFNGWGFDKSFPNQGKKISNTNIWVLKTRFPKNARLDYKILINGNNWIIDPANPYQQWSGVGGGSPNSELRMPEWNEDIEQKTNPSISHGTLFSDILVNSKILNYQITYSIYLPTNYDKLGKLPTMYVTDGYEYLHPQLGNMITVLDNLIAEKKMKPIAVVFVDHREPVNRSNNRRMQELAMNSTYLDFFVNELLPDAEKRYPVTTDFKERGIMGTSMGGLAATYFAFTKPGVFGLVGIQSPAFWTKPQIYQLCSNPASPTMIISMTSGLINDTSKESRKMKEILASSSCVYQYREVNEGHSWGNWRSLIDDVLIDLYGLKASN